MYTVRARVPIAINRSLIADVVLAIGLGVFAIAVTSMSGGAWGMDVRRPLDLGGGALIAAAALSLVVRRRWPIATLAVAAVTTSAYLIIGYPWGSALFPFFIAVYSVARHRPLPTAAPSALAALALLLIHSFTDMTEWSGLGGIIPGAAWVAVPFALGVTVRLTREASARERAETLRQHLDDERFRVAQEVHDIVGHGLAAIKMQSDVALHLMPKKPEQAEIALQAISRTSSDALEELRSTLSVVRHTTAEAARSPGPGLAQLGELRQRMSDAGVRVDMETVGEPRPMSSLTDVTAYRIVQESLTNVLKHSTAKVATVRVEYDDDAVLITVSNPVPQMADVAHAANRGAGLGIPGMRRRVTSLGGDFTAGPTEKGNFDVRASIPVGDVP